MSDAERLQAYVDIWWEAIDSFTTLLEELPAEAWSTPTDLAGWDVHDVAAHIAHLEALLVGVPHDEVEIGEPGHVTGMMGAFTEQGVVARKGRAHDDLINEIRESATRRHTALLADPPTDGSAPAPGLFGQLGWDVATLLRNRPLDVWMHEQDVRRAVGLPGGMDAAAGQHVADYLSESLGFVVGKKVGAPAGTTVVLEVEGSTPVAVRVDDSGRARADDTTGPADVRITMDRESFIVAAGGRRTPESVSIEGDHELGERIVAALGVTP